MPGFVPESVLKKRRTAAEIQAKKDAEGKSADKKAAADKKEMLKRAETYCAEYAKLENDSIRLRREAKASGSYYVPAEPKLAFVIRIRGASIPRVQSLRGLHGTFGQTPLPYPPPPHTRIRCVHCLGTHDPPVEFAEHDEKECFAHNTRFF